MQIKVSENEQKVLRTYIIADPNSLFMYLITTTYLGFFVYFVIIFTVAHIYRQRKVTKMILFVEKDPRLVSLLDLNLSVL